MGPAGGSGTLAVHSVEGPVAPGKAAAPGAAEELGTGGRAELNWKCGLCVFLPPIGRYQYQPKKVFFIYFVQYEVFPLEQRGFFSPKINADICI